MSHAAQREFFAKVKELFPKSFHRVTALDCGSFDVNGSLKDLFTESDYVGVDVRPGRNVDVVSLIHELPMHPETFKTVVSAEMLEHDEHWQESLKTMYRLLARGGLMVLSMAGPGRPEHGTLSVLDEGQIWGTSPNYYRPIDSHDLILVLDPERSFGSFSITESHEVHDLYFWGVKR